MTVENRTPDSHMLNQIDGQWEKLMAFVVYKLCGKDPVIITVKDMEQMAKEFAPGIPVLVTHGHYDAIEFRIVDEAAAARLTDHEKSMEGSA